MSTTSFIRPDLRNYCKASNLAFNEKIKEMQKMGKEVYHFAFGQSPFPIPKCFVDALKEFAGASEYLPVAGTGELRSAICDFHHHFEGIEYHAEQIVVGPGSKELIYLTMALFDGDILLVSPSWTTYAPQSRLAGHEPFIIQSDFEHQWKVTPKMIDDFCERNPLKERKLLVLNNPGNPAGTAYTDKELKDLSAAFRRNNILVLSDEIYGLLHFNRNHVPLAKHYPEGSLTTTGFSKWCSAGGWRVGYIIIPEAMNDFKAAIVSAASHTYSCAAAPMQFALAKGLRNLEELDDYVQKSALILQGVSDYCARELATVGVRSVPSEAGFYFMPDFEVCRAGLAEKGIRTNDEMAKAMLEEANVALMGSFAFLRPESELTTRFCFIDFDGGVAMKELDPKAGVDKAFIEKFAPNIVGGIENLKVFVKKYSK